MQLTHYCSTAGDSEPGFSFQDGSAGRSLPPVKAPKASIDPDNLPKKAPEEPTRTDKFSMTGVSIPFPCASIFLFCSVLGRELTICKQHSASNRREGWILPLFVVQI